MQNVAIIGTTGSIGKAFLEYYVSDNATDRVYSISRSKNNICLLYTSPSPRD